MKNNFAEKIRTLTLQKRLIMRLSQKEIAKRAGISLSVVSRLERGDTSVRMSSVSRVLAAVGVKIRVS